MPIFQRLTKEKLLKRCARNKTQNPNESFHAVIWRFNPKFTYVGMRTLESATCMALCQFSNEATFRSVLMRFMNIKPGTFVINGALEKSIENEAKQRRKKSNLIELKYERQN